MEVDGVPSWDGNSSTWIEYTEQVEWYVASCKPQHRSLCGARLVRMLRHTAKRAVRTLKPQQLSGTDGWQVLLKFLQQACATEPVPDLANHLENYFYDMRRAKGQAMIDYIQFEETMKPIISHHVQHTRP